MFAREGARVMGCDLDPAGAEATVTQAGEDGCAVDSLHPCDLTRQPDVQKLMDLTIQRHGRLDILANVAAWGAFAPFDEMNYQSQWGEEGLVADSGSDQSAISARNAGRGLGDNSIAASALIPVMHSSRTTTWSMTSSGTASVVIARLIPTMGWDVSRMVQPSPVAFLFRLARKNPGCTVLRCRKYRVMEIGDSLSKN